jgi:putative endonuclease
MAATGARGLAFESLAESHALAHGLRLVERNMRCRHGEIDLILRDADVLVFAEVRFRNSRNYGGAIASVDPRKQARLVAAAQFFLQAQPAMARLPCRFDVFAVGGSLDKPEVEWIRDAFRLS